MTARQTDGTECITMLHLRVAVDQARSMSVSTVEFKVPLNTLYR